MDIYPVELLGCMCSLFFNFWGTSILSSIMALPVIFPPTVHKGSLFSVLTSACNPCSHDSHPNRCEVTEVLLCVSLMIRILTIFSCICWPPCWIFFGKISIQVLCSFLMRLFFTFFFAVEFFEYLIYILTLYQMDDLQSIFSFV